MSSGANDGTEHVKTFSPPKARSNLARAGRKQDTQADSFAACEYCEKHFTARGKSGKIVAYRLGGVAEP